MIGENLLRFNKEQKYIIFDSETCNLNLMWEENVPWQWAWKECTLSQVISENDILVKWPKINISKKAAFITGFNQAKVDLYGIPPEEALEMIEKWIYDPQYIIIAHNALGFDIFMHNIHRKALGKAPDFSYMPRVIDTVTLARAIAVGTQPKPEDDRLLFQYKFANYFKKGIKVSIQALCTQFGIPYDGAQAHSALYDCGLLYEIWKKIVYQIEL